jgi:dipeptidyl-peptidase III
MKKVELLICAGMATLILSCGPGKQKGYKNEDSDVLDTFKYQTEQFADIKVLRYKIPLFESLKPAQKELIYYLYQAALAGRDILWDQNYKYNLMIRRDRKSVV